MIAKRFYLLYFCITFLRVHSTQQIIPVQNYPTYQQTFKSVPVTIPVSYQPVYGNCCSETHKVQIPINNQVDLAPVLSENINKLLINRILSNIGLQTIVDPSARLFNQYGTEVPKQVPNYSTTPNIINNYFIVPPGCLKCKNKAKDDPIESGNKSKIKIVKRKKFNEPASNKNSKLLRTAPKRDKSIRNDDWKVILKEENNYSNDALLSNLEKMERTANYNKDICNRKKEILIDCFDSELDIFKESNPQPDINPIKGKNTKSKKRSNKKKLEANNEDIFQETKHSNVQKKIIDKPIQKDIKNKINKHETKNTERMKAINNSGKALQIKQQEKLLQDYKKQFPNVPDDILKNMMNMNNRYHNILGFNYLNNLFPFNFNHMYQVPQIAKSGTNVINNKNKRRKQKNRKKPKRRRKDKKSKSIVDKLENTKVMTLAKDRETLSEETQASTGFFPTDSAEIFYTDITAEYIENQEEIESEVTKDRLENYEIVNKVSVDNFPELTKVDNSEKYLDDVLSQNTIRVNNTPEYNNQKDINNSYIDYNNPGEILPASNYEISYEQLPLNHFLEDTYSSVDIDDIQKQIKPNLEDKEEELLLPELGNEDVVPTINENGLIEDYYPIFTDNAYFGNNQPYYVNDINDKHYYITDENQNPERRLERFANFRPLAVLRDKLFNNFEETVNRRNGIASSFKTQPLDHNDMIEIRTPTDLEFPGFVTKEIKKEENNAKYVEQKSSIYSDFKTPLYDTFIKPYVENKRVPSKKIQENVGVETVYAPSKVIKYGLFEEEESTESSQINENNDLSYVIAKSPDYSEIFW